MERPVLDFHCTQLLEEFLLKKPVYEQLGKFVKEQLQACVKDSGIEVNAIETRLKGEQSFIGKLERKGHKYLSISDITDIFGARIITYYNEDVDRIASIIENLFKVDWDNSVDKRKMHQVNSFGYNSLHYICSVPCDLYQDSLHPELNEIRFEIQIRTALQHVWSAIQHDIGYKTDIETPEEYHRDLSRLAGLLELADNEFSRIRRDIADYRRRTALMVENGQLSHVELNGDTFQEYLNTAPFEKLNEKIASINAAELHPASFKPYLEVLKTLSLRTLGDVETLIRDYSDDAYQLALYQLGSTDIDILSSTVGIQNLCIVYLFRNGYGRQGLMKMFEIINGPSVNNAIMADIIIKQSERLSFGKTAAE